MEVYLTQIHTTTETPRLGSGVRWVKAKVGRKWVRMTCPFSGVSMRVRKELFRRLVRRA